MSTTRTITAKVAALVAGFALVGSSFAFAPSANAQTSAELQAQIAALLAQIAALQAQLNGGSSTTCTVFVRDMTIGARGTDVTSLQTFLISKGFTIPAGPTGYFGTQTRAAVAAFQSANGITPVAGYFGPLTRARVNAMCTVTPAPTPTPTPGTDTTLHGGEADLRNFDLVAGNDLSEGDTNQEIVSARFDVSGGDVRVQRVTVELTPTVSAGSANEHPWSYLDTLSVYNGSKKVGSIDVSSKSDWDQQNDDSDHSGSLDFYTIDIPVDTIIREGEQGELSIRADAQSSIDTGDQDQTFKVDVPDNGIRAVDSKGIQQYTGDVADTVTLGFNAAQNGDLNLTLSSDNPDSQVIVTDNTDTSDSVDVLAFNIRNKDDTSVDFNSMTFSVATSSPSGSPAANITDIIRRATLTLDGKDYVGDVNANNTIEFNNLDTTVSGNDTIDGSLAVELYGSDNHFLTSGETLTFSLAHANVDAEGHDTGDASTVSGSATGEVMTIGGDTGVQVSGTNNSTNESYNTTSPSSSTGTFTLTFSVKATGEDVYIEKNSVATTSAASSTAAVVIDPDLGGSTSGTVVNGSLSSTADTYSGNSNWYVIPAGSTKTFTVQVTFDPATSGYYQIGLDKIRFNSSASTSGLQTLEIDQNDSNFQTNQLYIH